MDASSTVAAAAAGGIFALLWAVASTYLFLRDTRTKRGDGAAEDGTRVVFSWTFHVESLRFFAYVNYVLMLAVGALITETSGLETIPDHTATVIFKLFGINHSCNWVDHNPARLIAAILVVPLIQAPLMLYCVFWHCRLAKDVAAGRVPRWLLNASRVVTPFNFITMAELHLWFVNNPDDTYGFIAHYVPYLMSQITVCLFQALNVPYLAYKGLLPWGIPSRAAWAYVSFFSALTLVYAVFVIATLAGDPIVAASRGGAHEAVARAITLSWATLAVVGTLVLSGKERLNGDVVMLTLGDDALSLEVEGAWKDAPTASGHSASFPSVSAGEEEAGGPDRELGDVDSAFFNVWERGGGRVGPLRIPDAASLRFGDVRGAIGTQLHVDSFRFVLGNAALLPADLEEWEVRCRYFGGAIRAGDGTLAQPYEIEIAMT